MRALPGAPKKKDETGGQVSPLLSKSVMDSVLEKI